MNETLTLRVLMTRRCPPGCPHCSCLEEEEEASWNEDDSEMLERFVHENGVREATFIGGEPTLFLPVRNNVARHLSSETSPTQFAHPDPFSNPSQRCPSFRSSSSLEVSFVPGRGFTLCAGPLHCSRMTTSHALFTKSTEIRSLPFMAQLSGAVGESLSRHFGLQDKGWSSPCEACLDILGNSHHPSLASLASEAAIPGALKKFPVAKRLSWDLLRLLPQEHYIFHYRLAGVMENDTLAKVLFPVTPEEERSSRIEIEAISAGSGSLLWEATKEFSCHDREGRLLLPECEMAGWRDNFIEIIDDGSFTGFVVKKSNRIAAICAGKRYVREEGPLYLAGLIAYRSGVFSRSEARIFKNEALGRFTKEALACNGKIYCMIGASNASSLRLFERLGMKPIQLIMEPK